VERASRLPCRYSYVCPKGAITSGGRTHSN